MSNITPRARFLSVPENISQHRKLLEHPQFQKSVDVAVAEHTRAIVALAGTQDLSAAGAQQAAAASFHMISGAAQFLEVFTRLAEPYQTAKPSEKITSLGDAN